MRGAGAFLHSPPPILQVDRLFEETGILRSKPHPLPSTNHPTECSGKIIPTWPVAATLLLAPLAPRQVTGKSVQFLTAV